MRVLFRALFQSEVLVGMGEVNPDIICRRDVVEQVPANSTAIYGMAMEIADEVEAAPREVDEIAVHCERKWQKGVTWV